MNATIASVDEESPGSDQIAVLQLVVARLDEVGVPYMVTGSTALNYYAVPRMTRDIDIVVELDVTRSEQLWNALSSEFYAEREAIDRAAVERRIVNVIHLDRLVKVDLIVRRSTEFARMEFSRRRRLDPLGGVWLVSPEDLVLSKLTWAQQSGSETQLRDVREVIRAVPDLDREYIAKWAGILGVSEAAARAGAR